MSRPLTVTFLALLLVGSATTVLAPFSGVPLVASASAADFTGRIKRIRIKKRGTNNGFSVGVRVFGSEGDSGVARATATLIDANGSIIDELTLGAAFRGAVVARTRTNAQDVGDAVVVFVDTGDGETAITVELSPEGMGEGANAEGWKAKVRLNPRGRLRVTVLNEDRTWDGTGVTAIAVRGENTDTVLPMDITTGKVTFAGTVTTDLNAYTSVTAQISLFDSSGALLESSSEVFEFEGTGVSEEADLDNVQMVAIAGGVGEFQLTTWTWAGGPTESLEVEVLDANTGESVLMTVDDQPVRTRRDFLAPVMFDPGEPATDYVYLVLVDYLDEAGDPVGQQQEVELRFPAFDGTAVAYDYAYSSDDAAAIAALEAENGTFLFLSYTGDEPIFGANIIFEEPFEGPAPLETEYSLASVGTWDKWVQVSDRNLPDQWVTTITSTTADGAVLSSDTATGSGSSVQARTEPSGGITVNLTVRGNLDVGGELKAMSADDSGGGDDSGSSSDCATPWIPWSCS